MANFLDMNTRADECEELAADARDRGDLNEFRSYTMTAARLRKQAARRERLLSRARENINNALSWPYEDRKIVAEEIEAMDQPRLLWVAHQLRKGAVA